MVPRPSLCQSRNALVDKPSHRCPSHRAVIFNPPVRVAKQGARGVTIRYQRLGLLRLHIRSNASRWKGCHPTCPGFPGCWEALGECGWGTRDGGGGTFERICSRRYPNIHGEPESPESIQPASDPIVWCV
jgi:hypothetical protein